MSIDPNAPADTNMMRIVHNALRRDLARAHTVLTCEPPPDGRQRSAIAEQLTWLVAFLEAHHRSEDHGLYPAVRERDPGAAELMWELVEIMAMPFRAGKFMAGGPEDDLQERTRNIGPRFLRYPEIRTPRDMIYLHRSLGGIYSMLRSLQVSANWRALSRPYHEQAIKRAEGRV